MAQFKATAMRYFRKNIILQEGSISSQWLDEQALALNEFVTNYPVELSQNSNATDKARKAIVMKYCKACMNHAMFKKTDKEESEALHNRQGWIYTASVSTPIGWRLSPRARRRNNPSGTIAPSLPQTTHKPTIHGRSHSKIQCRKYLLRNPCAGTPRHQPDADRRCGTPVEALTVCFSPARVKQARPWHIFVNMAWSR